MYVFYAKSRVFYMVNSRSRFQPCRWQVRCCLYSLQKFSGTSAYWVGHQLWPQTCWSSTLSDHSRYREHSVCWRLDVCLSRSCRCADSNVEMPYCKTAWDGTCSARSGTDFYLWLAQYPSTFCRVNLLTPSKVAAFRNISREETYISRLSSKKPGHSQ